MELNIGMTIGIPIVTQYGSSYGSFKGARLSDYSNPNPNTPNLNNADAKDIGEFKSFEETVKDFILARLGYPTIKVELTPFQIQTCIEEAISKLEYHAPYWLTQYAVFTTSGGVNVYELPPVIVNNLTDVWFRRSLFGLGATPGSLEYDFAIMFFTNTGLFNNYNVSQYLLMQMYLKQINKVLGNAVSWDIINNKYLQLHPMPESNEAVILEFRAVDAETLHPAYKNWIQKYSLCVAKEILGRVRSKFQTLPGPGGGSKLDGELLLAEAKEEKQLLIEELTSEIEGPPLFDTY
jgi:hypothetical protein